MAVDASDQSSPSPSSSFSHFSSAHHYYVAVDRVQFKMEALVDLLGVASQRSSLPIVLCCSSRDELDAVCATASNLTFISFASLYSDLAEGDRTQILGKFRQATIEWHRSLTIKSGGNHEDGNEENKAHMLVVTDVCLPLLPSGEAPVSARVLINYELPTKKETYLRRMSTCLAAGDGIVINMVVGGEVVTLKSIEESIGLVIAEMPLDISEIL